MRKTDRIYGMTTEMADAVTLRTEYLQSAIERLEKLQELEARYKSLTDRYGDSSVEIEVIIGSCCTVFGISRDELFGRRRTENVANARQIAMCLVRSKTRMSLKSIGQFFGGKNHGTVLHACRVVPDKCYNRSFLSKYEAVEGLVNLQL